MIVFQRKYSSISQQTFRENKDYYGYSIICATIAITALLFTTQLLIQTFIFDKLIADRILSNCYLAIIILPIIGLLLIKPHLHSRIVFEYSLKFIMCFITIITCTIILCMILMLTADTFKFFSFVPIKNFIFGLNWNPQNAIEYADNLGIIPLLSGTLLITLIALAISIPLGLLSAVFIAEYLNKKYAELVKSIIEILAGIPTVVYGYVAALFIAPQIRFLGQKLDIVISSESALAAGVVMGIMLIPYIMSLSYEFIKTIPSTLKDSSIAMGATKEEMILAVLIPTAWPGIIGGIIMAVSRAIGETMIVTMAAGLIARITFNPINSVTTITAQIVSLVSGDQEFDSPQTLSAPALAFTLFCMTLLLNIIAHKIITRFKRKMAYYA
ncbi:MAG: phosphate ABC transporter permease subunit PstC [Rickettsiales bacterium]|nr:phosphate ABC transporter permease subunit PstC [Rickettsiales bacterium]